MIKGITPRLAVAGYIKIGGLGEVRKSSGGNNWRVPVKYDHIVVTKTTRLKPPADGVLGDLEEDKAIMDLLARDADGFVRRVPIILHSNEIDEVFPTRYGCYVGKKLHCSGNGQKAIRKELAQEVQNGRKVTVYSGVENEINCTCPYLEATSGPICKPSGILHCSIPLKEAATAGAVHKWPTSSVISIQEMIASLQQIKAVFGVLRGVPLWFVVRAQQVSPGGKTSTVHVCHVEARAQDVLAVQRKALEIEAMRKKLGGDDSGYKLLVQVPASPNESAEESQAMAEEFGATPEENGPRMPEPDAEFKDITEAALAKIRKDVEDAKPSTSTQAPPPAATELPMTKYLVKAARQAKVGTRVFWVITVETAASTILETSSKVEAHFKLAQKLIGKFADMNLRPFKSNGKDCHEVLAIREAVEPQEDVAPPPDETREPGQEG